MALTNVEKQQVIDNIYALVEWADENQDAGIYLMSIEVHEETDKLPTLGIVKMPEKWKIV